MASNVTSNVRLNHLMLMLLVLSDWITDAASIDISLEKENSLTVLMTLASVVVGFLFTILLLISQCVVIWKGGDTNQELNCLRLQFLHAVFESIPEVVFRSISLARSEKNTEAIGSLVISILFIIVTAAKFYLNRPSGKDVITVFLRGLEVGMFVTVILFNTNSYISFAVQNRQSARWFQGIAMAYYLLLIAVVWLLITSLTSSQLWDSEKWDRADNLYMCVVWPLTLLSTAVMGDISYATRKNMVFVSFFIIAVVLYTFVATGSVKTGSVKHASSFIGAFVVIMVSLHMFRQFKIPMNAGWLAAYIVAFLVLSVIGTWFLKESQTTVSSSSSKPHKVQVTKKSSL